VPLLAISDVALALLVAGATALGAGVGGVIAGFVTMRVERDRQTFAAGLEAERERRAARIAARPIWEELNGARATFDHALEKGRWGRTTMETTAWRQHGETLAGLLTYPQWRTIMNAVILIALFEEHLQGIHHGLDERERENVTQGLEAVVAAMAALDPHLDAPDSAAPT
jgi:hypothetical protein